MGIVEKKSKRNEPLKELTEEERKIIKEEIDSAKFWSQMYKGLVGFAIFQQILIFCVGVVDLLISGPSLSTLFCVVLIFAFRGLFLEATALVSQSEKEIEEKGKMLERKH